MVEIIKRGLPPEERTYETTCSNCTTEFRFLRAEAEYQNDQRDGDYLKIACPVCKEPVFVAVRPLTR